MKNILLSSILALNLFLYGCATIYNPATGKEEFIFIGTQTEVALGKSMAQQLQLKLKMSDNKILKNKLTHIGESVARQSHRQDLVYNFFVVDDKELNAFALPGGFIFVNSGLVENTTDDELACVVGHEIGHISARHHVKKLQAELGYSIIMSIAFGKSGYTDVARALDIVSTLISLGFSRKDELLADKLGATYAYKAGYAPEAMISFFKKLEKEARKTGRLRPLVFLSSHPPIKERIKNIRYNIDVLKGKITTSQNTAVKSKL